MKIFRLLALLLLPTVAAMGQYSVTRTYLNVVQQAGLQFTTPVLGDATGTSFNGNFFTAGTYTLSGTAGKTLNFTNTVTLTGTDGTTMTFPGTSATVARIDAGQTFVGMNTFPGLTLTGSVITTRTAMPALAVNFNLPEQTYSGNGPQTFTYANNTAGEATRVILTASGGTLTPTIPSTFSYVQNTAITTLGVIASGNEMIVDILWTGARFEIIGDPVLVTGGGTAFLQITPSSTVGQVARVTGAGTTGYGAVDLADADAVTGVLPTGNQAVQVASRLGSHTTPDTTAGAITWSTAVYEVFANTATEYDLPAAAGYDGKAIIFYNTGSNVITIDPNGAEVIVRDGTVQTGGVTMTSAAAAGNYVVLFCDGVRWISLGFKGALAAGS